ncbi:MAG: hypothetical protein U0X86_000663 [Wolbachia endosymbiont of Xenopsylla cheopis]
MSSIIVNVVRLSAAGIVEFNPVIAAGIFVGVVALSATCFAIMKICEKVSKEKDNDPNISTCIALKKVLVSEYLKNSGVIVS